METCIMPDNPPYWRNYEAVKNHRERYHRHEVFGAYNRQHSIEDGLVIFLRPEQHNMGGKKDIHHNKDYDLMAKQCAQRVYEAVKGSRIDFMRRYGRNYL